MVDRPPLIDRFEAHVIEGPGELALVSGGDTLSRSELWIAAGSAAEEIRSVVGGGRRVVVIQLPNCTAWVVMFLAVLRAGHVPATPRSPCPRLTCATFRSDGTGPGRMR